MNRSMKTNKAMKRIILLVWVTFLLSCSTASMYDDTKLKDSISNLEARVTKLETLCNQMNSNISALQAVVVALQNKEYIESIKPLPDNQGYSFSFSSGKFVTVYNGKDGKNGTDGKDGENGRDGVDGKDGVTPVIGVRQDTDGVWYWTLNGDWLYVDDKKVKAVGVDGQDGTDGKDGVVPKLKIEEGMWYMSCDDGASWEQLGKATGDDGADAGIISVTEDGGYVHFGMSDGTVITIAKRMPLTISFDSEDVAITTGGASRTIGYTLTGASEKVVVKTLTQDGWKAKVNQKSSASGTIEITAPNPLVESEILVFVSDGGQTALAAINCVKATIVISQEKYEVEAVGGNIDVTAQTNTEFQVSIPDDAKSWLSYIPTKSMATKTFNLSAAANDNAFRRNAVVSLTDDSGNVIRSFVVSQAGDMSGLISIQCDVKGDLHSILEAYDKENIVKMKISGVLNDVDFLDIYYEMPALRYLDISDVNIDALPKDSFKKSTNVTTVILPKTLVTIPDDCFRESKITGELVIPASCETIGRYAFYNCRSLESVIFESGSRLKSYLAAAFSNCAALRSIVIPASCEEIGESAFKYCGSLKNVIFESESQLKTIGNYSFCSTSMTSIVIPSLCETIGMAAFYDCSSLENVTFDQDSRLKTIEGGYDSEIHYTGEYRYRRGSSYGAFCDCVSLRSIAIPAACETIGAAAFKNCKSLECVVFEQESKLRIIGGGPDDIVYGLKDSYYYGAFSNCTSLSQITIPKSVETIMPAAFKNCSSLESVIFEDGSRLCVIQGGYAIPYQNEQFTMPFYFGAFSDCTSLKSIVIPAGVKSILKTAFRNCTALESVSFEANSGLQYIEGGYYYRDVYMAGNKLYNLSPFAGCSSLRNITIPSGVSYIGSNVFKDCISLETVSFDSDSCLSALSGGYVDGKFPDKSESLSVGLFANCIALKKIVIPASVEKIGETCFLGCSSLTDLEFERDSFLQAIGNSSFKDCTQLHHIYLQNCTRLISIGDESFYGNNEIRLFQIGAGTPPSLGSEVFGSVGVYSVLKVPAGSESAYKAASGWNAFSSITAID